MPKNKKPILIILSTLVLLSISAVTIAIYITTNRTPSANYIFDIVNADLTQLTGLTHANDERIFLTERAGVIHILDTGKVLPVPFLDIRDRVNTEGNIEQGLLGLAFPPDHTETGYFYVSYTDTDFMLHVERFQVTDDPNVANIDSAESLLAVEQTTAAHNGGHLRFGPDGYLYISIGDGGESINPESTGQRKDNLLGKLLRLDVSGQLPYTIPPDNPFVDDADARPEIWLLGLRNPWQFSFVPDSRAMFITDVGWSSYEEVNYLPADSQGGENFGWRLYEGDWLVEQPEGADIPDIPADELVFPIYSYPHSRPDDYDGSFPVGCAVIGGFVYRGSELPELQGKYLYGDFCHGQIWTLTQNNDQWINELLTSTNQRISSIGEDSNGEIYMTTYLGEVRKLIIDTGERFTPDGDSDYDLVENAIDNCREVGNPTQADTWGDIGVGDACDQNFYTNGSSSYEVKMFLQHYGALHFYGCEDTNCGLVGVLESSELTTDNNLQIESTDFDGWIIEAEYTSDSGNNAVYNVRVLDEDGRVYVNNLQVLKSPTNITWRTIS